MTEQSVVSDVAVVVSLAVLIASPVLAYVGYLRTRGRWSRAKRIWIAAGIAFACAGGAFLCVSLTFLVPLKVGEVMPLVAILLIIVGAIVASVAAYYRWLDQLLEEP